MVSIAFEIRSLHRNALHGLLKALAVIAAVSLSFSACCFAGDSQSISNWQGESLDGRVLSFVDDSQAKVIFFLGVECPVARHYAAQLQALSVEFQGQPITFVGIDSNIQDSEDELKKLEEVVKLVRQFMSDGNHHRGYGMYMHRVDGQLPAVAGLAVMCERLIKILEGLAAIRWDVIFGI